MQNRIQNTLQGKAVKDIYSESDDKYVELSEETRFYRANEKELAERLDKDKRKGTQKLAYVIQEILAAQNAGLIAKNKNHAHNKFAAMILHNIGHKLSK